LTESTRIGKKSAPLVLGRRQRTRRGRLKRKKNGDVRDKKGGGEEWSKHGKVEHVSRKKEGWVAAAMHQRGGWVKLEVSRKSECSKRA